MSTRRTWFLPAGGAEPATVFTEAGGVRLEQAEPSPALIGSTINRLRAGRQALRAVPADQLYRAIDDTLAEWQAPGHPDREAAEAAFAATTGLPKSATPLSPALAAAGDRKSVV